MAIEVWEAALGAAATAAAGFFGRRSRGEKDANSAKALAEAYTLLVDDQRASIADARKHIHRQDEEIKSLREELRSVRVRDEAEITALRAELASARQELTVLRAELATERTEATHLRDRLALLEAQRPAA